MNDGYANKILTIDSDENKTLIESYIKDSVCRNYGYREDIVLNVIKNIEERIGIHLDNSQNKNLSNNEENTLSEEVQVTPIKQPTPYEQLLTEEYIVSLYFPLFSRYAHMDAQRIQEKLNIKDEEVYTLIRFLAKIKALRYNRYSQDFDVRVYSPDALRKLYRDWKNEEVLKSKPHLFSLQRIKEGVEHLLKLKFTNVKLLAKNLKTDENKAVTVFQELKRANIINDKGALVNPYMGASDVAKRVWCNC